MKIIAKFALATVTAAGLTVTTIGTAAADVMDHQHCMLTPAGWVRIAMGVSEVAPEEPALENFHERVHLGEPGARVRIVRIPVGGNARRTLRKPLHPNKNDDHRLTLTARVCVFTVCAAARHV